MTRISTAIGATAVAAAAAALVAACTSSGAIGQGTTASTAPAPVPTTTTVTIAKTTFTHQVTSVLTLTEKPTIIRTIATRTRTTTITFHPRYDRFGEGTYVVGQDINPGIFHTGGSGDCYWARLSNLSGQLDGVIANHLGGGPQTVEIQSGDRAFEIQGSCTFGRA